MKNIAAKSGLAGLAIAGLLAFSTLQTASIRGTVAPAEGAARAWAESSTDTVRALVINGTYEITNVKPGIYKIIIEAKPPYRNAAREGISVTNGQAANAGEIRLEK